ncbi:MAG TPA: hypothetical protein VKE40_11455 [Gemmataceae bacterium]|nr:hypothetical protein [Gemmataceae bacterium]
MSRKTPKLMLTGGVVACGLGGWHSHPSPPIISIKAGTATCYDDRDDSIVPRE